MRILDRIRRAALEIPSLRKSIEARRTKALRRELRTGRRRTR